MDRRWITLAAAGGGALLLGAALLRRRDGDAERPTNDEVDSHRGHPFDALAGHEYVRLTTFRRNGEPVHTPVWFAGVGGRLYVTTDPHSGKMKRLARNDRAVLTPCNAFGTPRGRGVGAVGRPYRDGDRRGERALREKYGWKMSLYRRLSGEPFVGSATLELRPLPQGPRA